MKSLCKDAEKLEELIVKYDRIYELPGRRWLFTFMEADNLSNLRRKIGLHEQQLHIWHTTLVYGSLRRLENGQELIFGAINGMSAEILAKVIAELRRGKEKTLKEELRKRGVSEGCIEQNVDVAADYVIAPPEERIRLETQSRSIGLDRDADLAGRPEHSKGSHSKEKGSEVKKSNRERPIYMEDSKRSHSKGKGSEATMPIHKRYVYIKVHKEHMDPRTLDTHNLPWEWDKVSFPIMACALKLYLC